MPEGDSRRVIPQLSRRNLARQSVREASKAENLHFQDQNALLTSSLKLLIKHSRA